jgi:endoglucanase
MGGGMGGGMGGEDGGMGGLDDLGEGEDDMDVGAIDTDADLTAETGELDTADAADTADTADTTDTPAPSTAETSLGGASVTGTTSSEGTSIASVPNVVTASELPEIPQDRGQWKYEIVDGKFTLNGTPLILKGVNWHGFENQEFLAHPLWDISMETGYKELAKRGVNAIRVPVSAELMMHIGNPDLLIGGTPTTPPKFAKQTDINFDKDLEGKPMSVAFDKFLKMAYKYNMLVMIDLHTFRAAPPNNRDASNASYEFAQEVEGIMKQKVSFPKATVQRLWAEFAKYLLKYPHVFGADLKNEPHAASWKDWSQAASEYGKAVLASNPHLFIVVEGVNEAESGYGGALGSAKDAPVDVGVPNKVIYSPHKYGPGIGHGITDTDEKSWDKHFGYLTNLGHCVMMGEWGIGITDDSAFNARLAAYMQRKGIHGFYWTFSFTSGDTLNILKKGSTDTKLVINEKSYEVMDIAGKNATTLKFP